MTTTRSTDDQSTPQATRSRRRYLLLLLIPVLAVGWWLGSPLFLDDTVDEAFPVAADAPSTSAAETDSVSEPVDEEAAADVSAPSTASTPTTAPAAEPELIAGGSFDGFDAVHQGSGSASFYDLGGAITLRFEDFDVTNGPDLRVNLVFDDGSMLDLGALKGNVGNQNYDVPADVDLEGVSSVVIYCRAFSVPFAEAVIG